MYGEDIGLVDKFTISYVRNVKGFRRRIGQIEVYSFPCQALLYRSLKTLMPLMLVAYSNAH